MRTLLLILVLALLVGWWWLRRREQPAPARPARRLPRAAATGEYHAVAIRTTAGACGAARRLEGRRFLASEAPRLPLPDCDRATCECRFQHYDDRRSGRDRRSPFGSGGLAAGTGSYEQERRRREGRRQDD